MSKDTWEAVAFMCFILAMAALFICMALPMLHEDVLYKPTGDTQYEDVCARLYNPPQTTDRR